MTVQPTAAEMIDAMREKARGLWGDEFTLKVTLWEDGDYRLVAYHHKPERHEGEVVRRDFEELWHQSGKTPPDKAVLAETWHEGNAHRDEERQLDNGEAELVNLP